MTDNEKLMLDTLREVRRVIMNGMPDGACAVASMIDDAEKAVAPAKTYVVRWEIETSAYSVAGAARNALTAQYTHPTHRVGNDNVVSVAEITISSPTVRREEKPVVVRLTDVNLTDL